MIRPQYSENDSEISKILTDIGLKKNEARTLALFFRRKELTSREIERIVDLRQPEVSIALKNLLNHKWIRISRYISGSHGRPVHIYILSVTIEELLEEKLKKIGKEFKNKIESVERIKELIDGGNITK